MYQATHFVPSFPLTPFIYRTPPFPLHPPQWMADIYKLFQLLSVFTAHTVLTCLFHSAHTCTALHTSLHFTLLIQAQQLFAIHTFCQKTETWLFKKKKKKKEKHKQIIDLPCSPYTSLIFIGIQEVFNLLCQNEAVQV